jgi:hypothetical protein
VANNLLEQRRAQMFPKLTSAQFARMERHSKPYAGAQAKSSRSWATHRVVSSWWRREVSRCRLRRRPLKPPPATSYSTF